MHAFSCRRTDEVGGWLGSWVCRETARGYDLGHHDIRGHIQSQPHAACYQPMQRTALVAGKPARHAIWDSSLTLTRWAAARIDSQRGCLATRYTHTWRLAG